MGSEMSSPNVDCLSPQTADQPKIQEFEFRRKLGQGGFATVWHFYDPASGRDVAVKRFSLCGTTNTNAIDLIQSYQTEIDLLKKVDHSRIVKFYSCLANGPFLDLVLEYVGGGALTQVLPLQEQVAKQFIRQVLEGANILRESAGSVKLTDFGISHRISDLSTVMDISGTLNFMAPEIFKKQKASAKVDVCIARHLVKDIRYRLPTGTSQAARQFLKSLLEFDPAKRPSAAQALASKYMLQKTVDKPSKSVNPMPAASLASTLLIEDVAYEIETNQLVESESSNVAVLCIDVYKKYRAAKNFAQIAKEITENAKTMEPYNRNFTAVVCCVYPTKITTKFSYAAESCIRLVIPTDKIRIELYLQKADFVTKAPTQLEVEEHLKTLPYDMGKICISLEKKFSGCWTIVKAPMSSESIGAFAYSPTDYCRTYEIAFHRIFHKNKLISAAQCARIELAQILRNELSANKESIPNMIEEISQKHYEAKALDKITNEVLDRVSKMHPFIHSTNPIRCFMYTKGQQVVSAKVGTYLSLNIDNHQFTLYQDRFKEPPKSYSFADVTKYLQQLADKYTAEIDVDAVINKALEAKFPKFHWNLVIVTNDYDSFAIASRPPHLPMVEVKGPKEERFFAWAMKKKKFNTLRQRLSCV